MPRLVLGLLCAPVASVMALLIPQVYRVLINSTLHHGGEASGVLLAAILVLALGKLEAFFALHNS